GGFDLILCRNVLMYFPPESQQRIAARLISALAPKGWIAVSPAEASAELFRPLRAVNLPDAILFQSGGQPAPAVSHTAALPAASPVPAAPPIRPDATPAHGAAYALDRAQCLANEGRHREARTLCETALAADPLSHEAHALLAAIDAEAGDLETAMQAARQGLYLKPDCPEIGFLMAGLLMRTGKPASGIRHMRRILDELEGVPDQQIVGSLDGVTARAMRELVRSALADAVFDEDESDDKSVSSRF
ncbi:MAG: CheR family methyltransferase, partial [Alphaproteobacteria bacterium]